MKKQIFKSGIVMSVLFTLVILTAACKQEVAAPEKAAITPDTANASAAQATTSRVAKIVFVGQKQACPCTRKRIDGSWAALQAAAGARKHILIEQLYMDTDEAKVEPYEEMRAIMVLPAVYLLDGSGKLIDMLQGEITADNFNHALQ